VKTRLSAAGRAALLAAIPVFFFLTSCGERGSGIIRVQDGAAVSFEELVEDLASVPLVFIGELHTSRGHHEAQLRVIRALAEKGEKVAIGLEMFHDGHQQELDGWLSGEVETEEFLGVYYHNWNLPWPLYRDIFLLARARGLPMIGLNASPDLTSQVAVHGFDSLTPSQIGELPGVSCNVDPEYEDFIRRALGDPRHRSGSFRYFCEAQMVWDTTMARKVVDYLDQNEDATLIVLAGSGHSWKRGIPLQVQMLAGPPFRTILPEHEDRPSRENVLPEDTDYLWTGL
jgi:uncharacterized iron-regulated protein